ncbi:MAG: hypothetical protein OXM61_16775 [Candidatus Poribacteria bacterium]|nr:hypothetical protein [Candidatus Poribacteria bacterium]
MSILSGGINLGAGGGSGGGADLSAVNNAIALLTSQVDALEAVEGKKGILNAGNTGVIPAVNQNTPGAIGGRLLPLVSLDSENDLFSDLSTANNTVNIPAGRYLGKVLFNELRPAQASGFRSSIAIRVQRLVNNTWQDIPNAFSVEYYRGGNDQIPANSGVLFELDCFLLEIDSDETIRFRCYTHPQFTQSQNAAWQATSATITVVEIGKFVAPAVTTRELQYGLWNTDTNTFVTANSGKVAFQRLPASVTFDSPLTDDGTIYNASNEPNRRWYLLFPPGVYYNHIHIGHEDFDGFFSLRSSYTGPGRLVLSSFLGAFTRTDSSPITVDLVSL